MKLSVVRIFIMLLLVVGATEVLACTFSSDCDNGYYCNSKTKTCTMGRWPNGGCTWDHDCLDGYGCSGGSCVEMGGDDYECTWNSDCDNGYYCNSKTKTCTMGRWPNGGCTWDHDCLDGYECEDGECRSRGNAKRAELDNTLSVLGLK